ncbi:MAG: Trk system potassium transporter TrkA [Oscillospiraceae bacterium]|nr:Trk system potassium transporter TrkA [Oscillospiraceae bacterium]
MNIIIAGDGKVGSALTRQLTSEGYDVTVIDSNPQVLESSVERYDVTSVQGNCAAMSVLLQAGVKDADLLIAATNADEVNLLCCTTAHALNPRLHTIARIRNPEYSDQIYRMRDVFGLSMIFNPEQQAAREIERLLKYPGFLRRDVFAQGRTEIVELRIDKNSKLLNVRLIDMMGIIKCRVLVCAVLRDGSTVVPNSGDFTFREGDRIFVTAPTKDLTTLLKNLGIITRRVRRVLLCGGGRVSFYLAAALEKSGISVQIIEKNYDRCQELCAQLPEVDIIHGDSSDLELLESQRLSEYDAVVTLTGEDELNMILSLYAGSVGIPQVITKLGHASSRSIIDSLNLGSVVCPKDLCVSNIVRYVRAMQNQTGAAVSVHAIADGQVEAMEFLVDENTKNCDTPLKNLKPKANVLIASITRGSKTEIANGDSMFHKGDTLVVVTNGRGAVRQLNDIFA